MEGDSYNRGGFIAFMFSLIFSLGFMAYLALYYKIDLKEIPQPAQQQQSLDQAKESGDKPVDVSGIQKPWEPNDTMLAYGHQVFKQNCAVCHGEKGLGNGPAGATLVPKPRNFVEGKWLNGGDSINLFKTISTGIKGSAMASFAHLPAKDRWGVIQFIRSITHNKIKDDPKKLEAFGETTLK